MVSSLQISGEPWAEVLASEHNDLASIEIAKARGFKCERCWHYTDDVGLDSEYNDICQRCVSNIKGEGEVRNYA